MKSQFSQEWKRLMLTSLLSPRSASIVVFNIFNFRKAPLTEHSFRSSVSETVYQRRLQLSNCRHTRRDRGELGILQRASILPPSTCAKGPSMETTLAAVMTCFITNTTTE